VLTRRAERLGGGCHHRWISKGSETDHRASLPVIGNSTDRFPAHSGHVLQPLNMAIAGPPNTAFKQKLEKRPYNVSKAGGVHKANVLREIIFAAFGNGGSVQTHHSPSSTSGFRASELVPMGSEAPKVLIPCFDQQCLRL
jgi:hypothetical protein